LLSTFPKLLIDIQEVNKSTETRLVFLSGSTCWTMFEPLSGRDISNYPTTPSLWFWRKRKAPVLPGLGELLWGSKDWNDGEG
jgi:hypothetical protein